MRLNHDGRPAADLLHELDELKARDVDWKSGRAFSLAYFAGQDVLDLATAAYSKYLSANALNPAAFPSLAQMQREVVGWMIDLLNGGPEAAGFMTTGGTESILMAVKAARTRGRQRGITAPEMVLPASAHAAFEKGAEYFGVKSVRVPVRPDYRADVAAMEKAITPNTMVVVGSAPQYPQGVVDPIAEIAALATTRDINCHVDACMGGVTLPMLERLGHKLPLFDFRVPGVTSISVDLHKYGYTAKGASVILHRNKDLRRHQTFSTENWLGGAYASSGVMGTKGGGSIAAAWAVMQYLGESGYLRLTQQARSATEALVAGLKSIPGLRVLAEPDATLVSYTFDDADTFAVGTALRRRGWLCDEQKPPPSLHCTVNAVHGPVIDEFLAALRDAIAEAKTSAAPGVQKAYAGAE